MSKLVQASWSWEDLRILKKTGHVQLHKISHGSSVLKASSNVWQLLLSIPIFHTKRTWPWLNNCLQASNTFFGRRMKVAVWSLSSLTLSRQWSRQTCQVLLKVRRWWYRTAQRCDQRFELSDWLWHHCLFSWVEAARTHHHPRATTHTTHAHTFAHGRTATSTTTPFAIATAAWAASTATAAATTARRPTPTTSTASATRRPTSRRTTTRRPIASRSTSRPTAMTTTAFAPSTPTTTSTGATAASAAAWTARSAWTMASSTAPTTSTATASTTAIATTTTTSTASFAAPSTTTSSTASTASTTTTCTCSTATPCRTRIATAAITTTTRCVKWSIPWSIKIQLAWISTLVEQLQIQELLNLYCKTTQQSQLSCTLTSAAKLQWLASYSKCEKHSV